jgi:hypothetical protein
VSSSAGGSVSVSGAWVQLCITLVDVVVIAQGEDVADVDNVVERSYIMTLVVVLSC